MTKTKRVAGKGTTDFWRIAAEFRESLPAWAPINAGYERRHVIEIGGGSWVVCLKIHAMRHDDGTGKGGEGLRFMSSVTLWPPKLTRAKRASLTRSGWYKAVARVLQQEGYRGEWRPSPWGVFGDFWKDLPNAPAVFQEVRQLDSRRLMDQIAHL